MSSRRTPAPDIAACALLLFAATLLFSVLRAIYSSATRSTAVLGVVIYGGLLLVCALTARGVFLRRPWALPAGVILLLFALGAALVSFHVPESAELPAGILGILGSVLLLARRGEFAASEQA